MTKASDLRIGNFLTFSNGIQPSKTIQVGRRFFSSAAIEPEDGDFQVAPYYKPIPLTDEWLMRLGFTKEDRRVEFLYRLGRYMFAIGSTISVEFDSGPGGECYELYTDIDTVHQLQNLHYALTGEELSTTNLK